MLQQIRTSILGKGLSLAMILVLLFNIIAPSTSYALTGGPVQPEFSAFTPIGTSDMVDLGSGDFSYNLPLMDVGGFPINLAYNSGVAMDDEASWVGLGWNLSIGQINRQMRGIPDDFRGDEMTYENNMKDNYTVGSSFSFTPAVVGVDVNGKSNADSLYPQLKFTVGISAQYNSYAGMSLSPSAGATFSISENASVGLNVTSSPDGLTVSPNLSLNAKVTSEKGRSQNLGGSFGISFNSRQGITNYNMSASSSKSTGNEYAKKHKYDYQASGGIGSTVSYAPNTYTPSVNDGLTSANFTFNAALGSEFFGGEGQGQITGWGSTQFIAEKIKTEKAFGYENTEKANTEAVKDFNREKDGNFSVNSTNLPITNYTYDMYTVQGQGVGGMFRPYRSQIGFVNDNQSISGGGGGSGGIEVGVGSAAHFGGDIEVTISSTRSGLWHEDNAALDNLVSTTPTDPLYEEVYFKNVGDLSVDDEAALYGDQSSGPGGKIPARLSITGNPYNRSLESNYEIKSPINENFYTDAAFSAAHKRTERVRRNQNIQRVTIIEALNDDEPLLGFNVTAADALGQDYHTAGFIVTRNDGARYIYGEPLYNTIKKEVTFATGSEVGGVLGTSGSTGNVSTGLVPYTPLIDNSIFNPKGDHFFERITTPAYAHTFLLTALVSSDYSDVDDVTGPSEGDFGSYTKFTYQNTGIYKWRIPFEENKASYNEGLKTDPTDDKGSYTYGEKETRYISKIETKTHVARFFISPRHDAYGVQNENGGIATSGSRSYQLDSIALYSAKEYKEAINGDVLPSAVPIKEVHFVYDYSLCQGVPNNDNDPFDGDGDGVEDETNDGGKLTLRKVYFTYRNSNMGKYSAYDFRYGDADHNGTEDAAYNPDYNLKGYDVWGNYLPNTADPTSGPLDDLPAAEFNYVNQESANTDIYASAWSLTDIKLPSTGEIQVNYESDEYQFVQDQPTMRMFKIVGSGDNIDGFESSSSFDFAPTSQTDDEGLLFTSGLSKDPAEYIYIQLPAEDNGITETEFRTKYLLPIVQRQKGLIYFRMLMNMNHDGGKPDNWENGYFDYITGYFEVDMAGSGVFDDGMDITYGSIHINPVPQEGGFSEFSSELVNPMAKAGWHFARKYLPKYVYGFPEQNESDDPGVILDAVLQIADNLAEVFKGANGLLKEKEIARRFIPEKSWIRLMEPGKAKKGGGCRVTQLVLTDEWAQMTSGEAGGLDGTRDQMYGQVYSYVLDEKDANGDPVYSSSGVATYEPIGSKENPFVQPVFVNVNRLLAPDEENYMEKPFGESFFPSPTVTYSRVEVKNLERTKENYVLQKHATGKVVTEFYTSRDFPTLVGQTKLDVREDDNPVLQSLLHVDVKKHITLSQGYVAHVNDMNGKMKKQLVYAEDQPQPISGVEYKYAVNDAPGPDDLDPDPFVLIVGTEGKINNTVTAIYPDGSINQQTLGVEYDVINDLREMKSSTTVVGVNGNVATFLIGLIPAIIPVPLPDYAHHEDQLRMAVTTKVINTFGVLRETIAYDAGASVSTKNLAWDAFTGEVLLTETVNEYGDHYYSFNYPAHWYYDGMGMAGLNSGVSLTVDETVTPGEFELSSAAAPALYLRNGDEVLVNAGTTSQYVAWAHAVTGTEFKLLDADGLELSGLTNPFTMKVIRSGRRNIQNTQMASVVTQNHPINGLSQIPSTFLEAGLPDSVVNAGAVEFSDDWALQCECGIDNVEGIYNPYRYNTKGVWRALRSHLYLTGRNQSASAPDPRNDGFYAAFAPFYQNDGSGTWSTVNTNWTFTSEVSEFSPHGFELENKDALDRYSAAQYGYNYSFPMAVGANTRYSQMGFDGFEDYTGFEGCTENEHFGFREVLSPMVSYPPGSPYKVKGYADVVNAKSHTGSYSLKVSKGGSIVKVYQMSCDIEP